MLEKIRCGFVIGTQYLSVCFNLAVRSICQFEASVHYLLLFFLFCMAAYQEVSLVKCSCMAEHIVMTLVLSTAFYPAMLQCIGWKAKSLLQLYRQYYVTPVTVFGK